MILCNELEILDMMEIEQTIDPMLIEEVFFVLVPVKGLIEKDKMISR